MDIFPEMLDKAAQQTFHLLGLRDPEKVVGALNHLERCIASAAVLLLG
jgi:hypothetical protein